MKPIFLSLDLYRDKTGTQTSPSADLSPLIVAKNAPIHDQNALYRDNARPGISGSELVTKRSRVSC